MKSLYFYKKSYSFPKNLENLSKYFNLYNSKLNKSGRNNFGRVCVRHQGGGHKQNYRLLDFKNKHKNYRLISIEYDPNRSSFIGLFFDFTKNKLFFDTCCEGQKIGFSYKVSSSVDDISVGNKMLLENIPLGTLVNSLEIKSGKGAQYLRSAGTFGKLQQKNSKLGLARIKMPSKKNIFVSLNCLATIGIVSNISHKNKNMAKAGRNRWLNIRPTVRGVAMNPVDHPHGGGEGKTSGGRHSVTPWGKLTKGKKTVKVSTRIKNVIQF